MDVDYEEILERFRVTQRGRDKSQAICPCHSDREASLSISRGNKGTVLNCHAGCKTEDIVAAVGLTMADLFNDSPTKPVNADSKPEWVRYLLGFAARKWGDGATLEQVYNYHNMDNGAYAYSRIRFRRADGQKELVYGQFNESHTKITIGLSGKRAKDFHAAYGNLQAIAEAREQHQLIFYAEGEKDVLTMQGHGFAATFTCGGVSDWRSEASELVRGGLLVILRDNDRPGEELAERAARDCHGVAKSVKIICPSDREKGDISDFFQDGHGLDGLMQLILDAPVYEPPEGQEPVTQTDGEEPSDTEGQGDLSQFHWLTKDGQPRGTKDGRIEQDIITQHPMFVMDGRIWIYDNGVYRKDKAGRINAYIKAHLFERYHNAPVIKRIRDMFLLDPELYKDYGQVNAYDRHLINFTNGMWDCKAQKMLPHDPAMLSINQIPHEYHPDSPPPRGKAVDAFLLHVTGGDPGKLQMLMEFVGLAMGVDPSFEKILMVVGEGGSGKSTLLGLISAAIGEENCTAIDPQDIESNKFALAELKGKTASIVADISTNDLQDVSKIKRLSGGKDQVKMEAKFGDLETAANYAKMIFATNALPEPRDERTRAFYRRLLVLRMDKLPAKEDHDLSEKLEAEVDYFISLAIDALAKLYRDGQFTESLESKHEVIALRNFADTTAGFLNEHCQRDEGGKVEKNALYAAYENYCRDEAGRTPLSPARFYRAIESKGIKTTKSHGIRYFIGLKLSQELSSKMGADGGQVGGRLGAGFGHRGAGFEFQDVAEKDIPFD